MSASPSWPCTGQQVTVVVGDVDRFAIVDHAEPSQHLVLREPVGAAPPPAAGTPLVLLWCTAGGHHQLQARLGEVVRDRMPLWRLSDMATPTVSQRRAHTRAPDALRGQIVHAERTWPAVVADLGAGGARCVLEQPDDLAVGNRVLLKVNVDGHDLLIGGEVLEVSDEGGSRTAARLRFADMGRMADVVHRRVMQQQRRLRAARRT